MATIAILDSNVLGVVTNPKRTQKVVETIMRVEHLQSRGVIIAVSQLSDYEVGRELELSNLIESLKHLADYINKVLYLDIDRPTTRRAQKVWADLRRIGLPTADRKSLDGDAILLAQAAILIDEGNRVVIATTNVRHLSRLVDARHLFDDNWDDVR